MQTSYRLLDRIGVSGTAEIFLAVREQPPHGEELVVYKSVLPAVREDAELVEIFAREARRAAGLQHDNIVKTLDVQRPQHGAFVVTEYVSGEDLGVILARMTSRGTTVPPAIAYRVMLDVAEALGCAHGACAPDGALRPLVHGGLYPPNVLVGYDGRTRVRDFGAALADSAHVYGDPAALRRRLAYTAPESSLQGRVDTRADVFSWGVLAWELLSGRPLYDQPTHAELVRAVAEGTPSPPSSLNPEVVVALDQVVMQALAKRAEDRYPSALELRPALDRALSTVRVASTEAVAAWVQSAFADELKWRLALEARALGKPVTLPPTLPAAEATQIVSFPPPPRRRWLPMALAAIGVVAVGVVAGLVWWSGGQGLVPTSYRGDEGAVDRALVAQEPTASAVGSAQADDRHGAAATVEEVTLQVHVEPPDATLFVDGERRAQPVGAVGTAIAVPAGATVLLRAVLEGYVTKELPVVAPQRGTEQVYLDLAPSAQSPVAAAGHETTKPAPRGRRARARAARAAARAARVAAARQAEAADRAALDHSAELVIDYAPSEATIAVDGKTYAGPSPLRVTGLASGAHVVSAKASGYTTGERSVTVQPGHPLSVSIRLALRMSTVDFVSVPQGAAVVVDGQPKGRTPLLGLTLSPGRVHKLEARLEGFRDWATEITPDEGRNPMVVATLAPVAAAATSSSAAGRSQPDISVPLKRVGNELRGASLFKSKCGACHGRSAPAVSPRRYTANQWSRYFLTRRHTSRAPWRDSFTLGELADVKAYLMAKAADVDDTPAAGFR